MLKAALCGNYVNFGVFRLYGDDALDNVLNCFVKLLLSIPLSDLMVSSFPICLQKLFTIVYTHLAEFYITFGLVTLQDFPKLSQTYYVLLECVAQDHMNFLASLDPSMFLYILQSISEGLAALGKLHFLFKKSEAFY